MIAARWDVPVDEDGQTTARRPIPTLVSLHFLRSALRRRWWVCALCTVLGLLASVTFLVASPASQAKAALVLAHDPQVDASRAMATDVSLLMTRTVASNTIANLGLTMTPDEFLESVTAESVSSELLTLTITAPTDAEAIRRLAALTSVYLAFRGEQLSTQSNVLVDGMQQRIKKLQGDVADLSQRIEQLSRAGRSGASKLSDAIAQRATLQGQIETLQQSVEEATLRNGSVISSSRVIDPAAVDAAGAKRRTALTLASGLIGGAALGCGIVLFLAITSDRLRRRSDVAAAFEVPVPVSVGKITPLSKQWLWLPHMHAVDAHRAGERQRLAHAIEMELPVPGGQGRLAVACIDNADEVRFAVAIAAADLAARGFSVAVIDLTERGGLHVEPSIPDSTGPTILRPRGVPALAASLADLRDVGREDGGSPSLERTDITLVLADLDPSVGADHVKAWSDQAIVVVTAGRSSAERVRTAADLVRTAGLDLRFAAVVRTERTDDSSGVAGFAASEREHEAQAGDRSLEADSPPTIETEQMLAADQQATAEEPLAAAKQQAQAEQRSKDPQPAEERQPAAAGAAAEEQPTDVVLPADTEVADEGEQQAEVDEPEGADAEAEEQQAEAEQQTTDAEQPAREPQAADARQAEGHKTAEELSADSEEQSAETERLAEVAPPEVDEPSEAEVAEAEATEAETRADEERQAAETQADQESAAEAEQAPGERAVTEVGAEVEQLTGRKEAAEAEMVDVEPQAEAEMVDVEPQAEAEMVDVEPQAEAEMVDIEPQAEAEMVDIEPQAEAEMVDIEPQAEAEMVDIEPQAEAEMVDIEPQAEAEMVDIEPQAEAEMVDAEPQADDEQEAAELQAEVEAADAGAKTAQLAAEQPAAEIEQLAEPELPEAQERAQGEATEAEVAEAETPAEDEEQTSVERRTAEDQEDQRLEDHQTDVEREEQHTAEEQLTAQERSAEAEVADLEHQVEADQETAQQPAVIDEPATDGELIGADGPADADEQATDKPGDAAQQPDTEQAADAKKTAEPDQVAYPVAETTLEGWNLYIDEYWDGSLEGHYSKHDSAVNGEVGGARVVRDEPLASKNGNETRPVPELRAEANGQATADEPTSDDQVSNAETSTGTKRRNRRRNIKAQVNRRSSRV